MGTILKRPARSVVLKWRFVNLFFVIALAATGCAAPGGEEDRKAVENANRAIESANEAVAEHDRLFLEARKLYEESFAAIEDGRPPDREVARIRRARETLGEARGKLDEAREPLGRVEDLDVAPEVKEYARLLSEAMETRAAAEDREIEYYRILERDPVLAREREKATKTLGEAREGYEKAEVAQDRVQELTESEPNLFADEG